MHIFVFLKFSLTQRYFLFGLLTGIPTKMQGDNNKYQLVLGKPSSSLTFQVTILWADKHWTRTPENPHAQHLSNFLARDPRPPRSTRPLATCLWPVSSRSWARRPGGPPGQSPSNSRPTGRGGVRWRGPGTRAWTVLANKRRPGRPRGSAARRRVQRSAAPGGGGHTGAPPATGGCSALAHSSYPALGHHTQLAPSARQPGQNCHMPVTQTRGEKEQPPRDSGGSGGLQNPGWSLARSARALPADVVGA
jgi:hypothetical protein